MPELTIKEEILQGLNDRQQEAVQATDGPVWVTAGAGSGKTRVLTRRIAYLIGVKHVSPSSIVAITFTKKAAGEMQERLVKLVGNKASAIQISTIHSLAARLLREHAFSVGLDPNFQVGDETYQNKVVKKILKDNKYDQDAKTVQRVVKSYKNSISQAKIRNLDPDQLYGKAISNRVNPRDVGSMFTLQYPLRVKIVYEAYQKQLKDDKRVDFDDLLMLAVELLKNHPLVLKLYQKKWQYFSVDEYQDTNLIQYEMIKRLASQSKNLCVVGDLDQSIYGFQGADHRNIEKFENDFKPIREIVLDQNYRSTNKILKIANGIIDQEPDRKSKTLWSDLGEGDPADVYYVDDMNAEGERVADLISQKLADGVSASEIAIIYRMNRASRVFEQALLSRQIPYQVVKGLNFYNRSEIRIAFAYLTLMLNLDDWVSWETVINTPSRGFGDKSIAKLKLLRDQQGSMQEAIANLDYDNGGLTAKQMTRFKELSQNLWRFNQRLQKSDSLDGLVNDLINIFDFRRNSAWSSTKDRWDSALGNWSELQVAIDQSVKAYRFKHPDQNVTGQELLQDFVNNWAIAWQDPDDEAKLNQDKVSLMTMHAAKGLEFNTVFIANAIVGEFPMQMPDSDDAEERRLAYVAVTRAKRHLYFMVPMEEMWYGQRKETEPSYFLDNFDPKLANWHHEEQSQYSGFNPQFGRWY